MVQKQPGEGGDDSQERGELIDFRAAGRRVGGARTLASAFAAERARVEECLLVTGPNVSKVIFCGTERTLISGVTPSKFPEVPEGGLIAEGVLRHARELADGLVLEMDSGEIYHYLSLPSGYEEGMKVRFIKGRDSILVRIV